MKQGGVDKGKYTGTLSFAVNERPELQTVNVTIQVSSLWAKILGAVLLALGILLAWWLSVRAPRRLLRLEALKPVAALQETINALLGELDHIKDKLGQEIPGDSWKSIRERLNKINQSLTIPALEKYLPAEIPKPYSGEQDKAGELKKFLAAQDNCVACLTLIVRDGMNNVLKDWPNHKNEILAALTTLNEKGESVTESTTIEQIKKEVTEAIEHYHSTTTKPGISSDAAVHGVIAPLTSQAISWQIKEISTIAWGIWGLLTFFVGLAVLIMNNPGFGTTLDLIFCFLWGFGLPTGIDKLQQLSPSGVATNIGITQFKATP